MRRLLALLSRVQQALMGLLHRVCQPAAPATGITCDPGAAAQVASDADNQKPEEARWAHDALRRRARDRVQSAALATRLLSFCCDWVHVVLLLEGPDPNPYNPHTVAEVREFTRWLLGSAPAVVKLERSARLSDGGLHIHLVVPAQILDSRLTRWQYVTADAVIIRAQRCGQDAVGAGTDDLSRLLNYLHKPSHAGWSWFRATGPQTPQYLAAEVAVAAGTAMCQALGYGRLRRTLWTQQLLMPSCWSAQTLSWAPEPIPALLPHLPETPRSLAAPLPSASAGQSLTGAPVSSAAPRSGIRAHQVAHQDHRCIREARVQLPRVPAPRWWPQVCHRLASQLGFP